MVLEQSFAAAVGYPVSSIKKCDGRHWFDLIVQVGPFVWDSFEKKIF
jgi:hypothetical protein